LTPVPAGRGYFPDARLAELKVFPELRVIPGPRNPAGHADYCDIAGDVAAIIASAFVPAAVDAVRRILSRRPEFIHDLLEHLHPPIRD
jgi:hypothetical protein